MSTQFLFKFFQLTLPVPGRVYPGGPDAKSDLKLILQIATNSRLKQGQDKKNQNKQIFYCRSLGKQCFKVEVQFFPDGSYKVIDDYTKMRHREGCEKSGETPTVIKIYNLMMLKRTLIQQFMNENFLCDSSPESILQRISGGKGEYFYCETVPDLESRRKLKKRFDNIINISIKKKKELKGGDDEKLSIEKIQMSQKKPKQKKANKNSHFKQNEPIKPKQFNKGKGSQSFSFANFNQEQFPFGKPKKRVKMQSNSSIYCFKNNNQQEQIKNPSQIFPIKAQSMFEESEQDYFKKNSDRHIAASLLNDNVHNFWPQSDNSIQAFSNGDRFKVDDIFASLRNSYFRSVERGSLAEINNSIEGLPFSNSDGVNRQ